MFDMSLREISNSLPQSIGSIGLPKPINQNSLDYSFLAVEFHTSFEQGLGDINDNHVGIDFDSIVSVALIDLMTVVEMGFDSIVYFTLQLGMEDERRDELVLI
ncbi:hypothetical protein L1887_24119 [Cichorium endivia]|nr:hypothetical protein L1887_24119 [Cichorium endivia]